MTVVLLVLETLLGFDSAMIEVENLTKAYGASVVVDGVTLTVPKGGVTAIIGPNGAGKSTLLGLMSRLLPPDRGHVRVADLDVVATPGDVLARKLAVLRQDNHTTARLTVRDLVGFGRYPHSGGRLSREDHEKVDQALGYLALAPVADRYLDELSGGQRQRAYVAMVLCQDTEYMLFDEPLSSLDIRHAVALMQLLRRATRELGKTAVIVVHDINIAANFADTVIAMKDGRLAFHGRAADVMTDDRLSAVYDVDISMRDIEGQRVALYFG